jgi:hypothetical protein
MDELATTLGFTLEELALNQAGRLSPQQVGQCVKSAAVMGLLMLVTLGLVAAMFLLVRPQGLMRFMLPALGLGAAAVCIAMGWQTMAAAVSRKVLMAEGTLELRSGHRQSTIVVVGAFRRTVDHAHKVLVPGQKYRVYYLAYSQDLLSLEPLPERP